jgi:acyl-CoA synthetase (AMP-forming)/AMP-acid ligase II
MNGLMMDYPLTLDRILAHAARLYPRRRIISKLPDGSEHSYTFADAHVRIKRLANALVALGVEPGDRVGTFAFNTYQHIELYFGIPGAGAVCHTLNIRLPLDQLAYIINHAEDKVIFVDAPLLPLFEKLAGRIDSVKHIVLFNAPADVQTQLPNVLQYETLLAAAEPEFAWRCTDENMAMGLCYTSGTTGNPKGALYSHRSMFLHTFGIVNAAAAGITPGDIVLPVVPQFHAMAWGLPYACLMNGAELVLPGAHLQPKPLAELIERHRVTFAAGVPTIWNALFQELKANPRNLSALRCLLVGGAAMPRSLIAGYELELGVNVLHAWGMTEISPLGSVSQLWGAQRALEPEARIALKAKQGYAVPGVEMRIVDDAGNTAPCDGITMGELQVRGPWISSAYFRVAPAPESFTTDGWFRTGDVCTIDADGYMNITDRTKDLIKSGGEWISSVALENALMAHPQVLEAAVIAVPDEKWTERPLACVVVKPGAAAPSDESLRAQLASEFAKFQIPERFVLVEAIPKTSVGKIDKKLIRQMYAAGKLPV